ADHQRAVEPVGGVVRAADRRRAPRGPPAHPRVGPDVRHPARRRHRSDAARRRPHRLLRVRVQRAVLRRRCRARADRRRDGGPPAPTPIPVTLLGRITAARARLPPVYWTVWLGTLINRLGGFVGPLLTFYLTRD